MLGLNDGSELHYEQSGAGHDIVWLAAGDNPGSNWRRHQTPAFDDRFRSTTYDARGVGLTRSSAQPPWSIEQHAADCAELIEAVCDPPVSLAGLSMGSLIATQLSYDRPDLVARAIVMGTCVRKTGFIREWEEAEIALRRAGIELPPAFATTHYAMQYLPAEVLGDDALWARIKPSLEADFGARDGAMLASVRWLPGPMNSPKRRTTVSPANCSVVFASAVSAVAVVRPPATGACSSSHASPPSA